MLEMARHCQKCQNMLERLFKLENARHSGPGKILENTRQFWSSSQSRWKVCMKCCFLDWWDDSARPSESLHCSVLAPPNNLFDLMRKVLPFQIKAFASKCWQKLPRALINFIDCLTFQPSRKRISKTTSIWWKHQKIPKLKSNSSLSMLLFIFQCQTRLF